VASSLPCSAGRKEGAIMFDRGVLHRQLFEDLLSGMEFPA